MVQEVKEQEGHILLHFDSPPANVGRVEFVVIVAYRQGQILYAQWREDGDWALPSGRVEHGETPEKTAHRELLEEAGATLKKMQVLCYMHCFMFGREYWGITFFGEIDKLGTPMDSDEIIDASMFTDVPVKVSRRFEGQARALHRAALNYLASNGSCAHD